MVIIGYLNIYLSYNRLFTPSKTPGKHRVFANLINVANLNLINVTYGHRYYNLTFVDCFELS